MYDALSGGVDVVVTLCAIDFCEHLADIAVYNDN